MPPKMARGLRPVDGRMLDVERQPVEAHAGQDAGGIQIAQREPGAEGRLAGGGVFVLTGLVFMRLCSSRIVEKSECIATRGVKQGTLVWHDPQPAIDRDVNQVFQRACGPA